MAAGLGAGRADGRRCGLEGDQEVAVEEVVERLGVLAVGDVFAVDVGRLKMAWLKSRRSWSLASR